jgi:hypothetical protein
MQPHHAKSFAVQNTLDKKMTFDPIPHLAFFLFPHCTATITQGKLPGQNCCVKKNNNFTILKTM